VQNLDVRPASFFEAGTDLQDAAGIGCDDDLSPAFEDVLDFSALQPFGHGWLGQIITAGAATADISFGQLDEMCSTLGVD